MNNKLTPNKKDGEKVFTKLIQKISKESPEIAHIVSMKASSVINKIIKIGQEKNNLVLEDIDKVESDLMAEIMRDGDLNKEDAKKISVLIMGFVAENIDYILTEMLNYQNAMLNK